MMMQKCTDLILASYGKNSIFLKFTLFICFSKNLPHLKESLKQFKAHLSELEELAPLKQWEVSDLSYQAAQSAMSLPPEEALAHLIDLSQNFPIRARYEINIYKKYKKIFQFIC